MVALTELSANCRQSIEYDCLKAPFEVDGKGYTWWVDRNGDEQYFWTGSNSKVHTCLCGVESSCYDQALSCNCDSLAAKQLSDSGTITDRLLLPITKLHFGVAISSDSEGEFTLGKLECSGQKIDQGMPTSCSDLWRIGHTLSGFYTIKGQEQLETVYCDLQKSFSDPDMQTWMGAQDVKSSAVYFHVQRNRSYAIEGTIIPYTIERLNIGGGMKNISTGIFTAPKAGIYSFAFTSAHANFEDYDALEGIVSLQHNNVSISYLGAIISNYDNNDGGSSISTTITLDLEFGDQVTAFLEGGAVGTIPDYPGISFVGMLLEEKLFLKNETNRDF